MSGSFMIVHKNILPDFCEKVIQARDMIKTKEVTTVTEAVHRVGISRNTYYKYKDYVFAYEGEHSMRKAIVSVILRDESGALSSVLSRISSHQASILTISQAVPVSNSANVLLSLNISDMQEPIDVLIQDIKDLDYVKNAHLEAVE